jgi:glycine hydroxymethyltransferase
MILCGPDMEKQINFRIFPGIQGGPLCHIIAAKAVAFKEAGTPGFRTYARQVTVNARTLAGALVKKGYHLITGGTDNHMILVDLSDRGITGKAAEHLLELVGITVNKNMIPFDQQPPLVTSGIRLGSQALTSRGMNADDMIHIAEFIDQALTSGKNESRCTDIRQEVTAFSRSFPAFEDTVA